MLALLSCHGVAPTGSGASSTSARDSSTSIRGPGELAARDPGLAPALDSGRESARAPALDPGAAIDEAAAYLLRHLDAEGRFDYLRRSSAPERKYNLLRHAGAIYALAQYHRSKPSPQLEAGIARAVRYLKKRYLRAPSDHSELLALFSDPKEEGGKPGSAKLGGAGLGLIALCYARKIDPRLVSLDELRRLARFIEFMQKPDGAFHSKYRDGHGFDSEFESLYYPGEAMLGLTLLFEIDPNPHWLDIAVRAAAQLVASRPERTRKRWPADHWMMLASAELLPLLERANSKAISQADFADHIEALGELIMASQLSEDEIGPGSAGAFGNAARSTPTATRLEGLLALLQNQGAERSTHLESAIRAGLVFLQRCQVRDESEERGGMPRSCLAQDPRDGEVRIDYVQHYLSAMLRARDLGLFVEAEGPGRGRAAAAVPNESSPIED